MDVWMYGRTDVHTDSPCILKDFVPSSSLRGRYPKRERVRERQICLFIGPSVLSSHSGLKLYEIDAFNS